MNDKRYYWLKLEENYFDLKVQKALRKLPSGSDMLICYLKMQLKYLNKGGLIEYQGIYEDLAEEIALDIDEETDLVKMTLGVLEKWRVIEPSEEGIFIAEMQSRIGSKTDSAIRVAKYRERQKMLHCNKDVTKCNLIQDIEKDIEKDIEIDKDIDNTTTNTIYDFVQDNFGRLITPVEYEEIGLWEDNELTRYAIKQALLNNKYNIKYISRILEDYKRNNIKTIQEAQAKEEEFLKRKENKQYGNKKSTSQETLERWRKEIEEARSNGIID